MLNKTACTINDKTIFNIGFNECATNFDIGNILDETADFTLKCTAFGIAGIAAITVFGLALALFFIVAFSIKNLVDTVKFGASVGVNVESKDIVDHVVANFKI